MKQVVIENPVINSPFFEPTQHFKFSEDGITDEIFEARRISSYFIPIAFNLDFSHLGNSVQGGKVWSGFLG